MTKARTVAGSPAIYRRTKASAALVEFAETDGQQQHPYPILLQARLAQRTQRNENQHQLNCAHQRQLGRRRQAHPRVADAEHHVGHGDDEEAGSRTLDKQATQRLLEYGAWVVQVRREADVRRFRSGRACRR